MRSKRKSSNKATSRKPAKRTVAKKFAKWPPERKLKKSPTNKLTSKNPAKKLTKRASKHSGGISIGAPKKAEQVNLVSSCKKIRFISQNSPEPTCEPNHLLW